MTVGTIQEKFRRRRSNNLSMMTYESFPYSGGDGDFTVDDYAMTSPLPREFQVIHDTTVPLLQNNDETNRDFIILAEFSELEGPIPLCTIPPTAADKTDIKLNTFAVHLMSTDYQVNTIGQFKICEDTQVLRKNVFRGVHVFMQYFTLYDIKARGFVRPFCFGYVSKDHVKLDKTIATLIHKFNKATKVLKQANRMWFAGELTQYLKKLSKAKDCFINELTPTPRVNEDGTIFSFESQADVGCDPDVITLDQIANQYSEIENILRVVVASNDSMLEQELFNLSQFLMDRCDEHSVLGQTLKNLRIGYGPDYVQESIEAINVPLVHPLKVKGESLRPLTTLGQLGTIQLIWRLSQVYHSLKEDMMYLEMSQITSDFEVNCAQNSAHKNISRISSSFNQKLTDSTTSILEITPEDGKYIMDPVVAFILEKVHAAVPVPAGGSDSKSGSYHTVSEEDSELLHPSPVQDNSPNPSSSMKVNGTSVAQEEENIENNSALDTTIVPNDDTEEDPTRDESPRSSLVYSDLTVISMSEAQNTSPISCQSSQFSVLSISNAISPSSCPSSSFSILTTATSSKNTSPESTNSTRPNLTPKSLPPARYSLSSCTSDEDNLPAFPVSTGTEETIHKRPWWTYGTDKGTATALSRGQPGYGLLNFFRHYHKIAHHTLYSILLGRPIIVCGNEEQKPKIARILNALIPLIPSLNDWKILKWHQGILVHEHLREFKLIGLCIPERLVVQDLLSPRDENYVTILNVEKKMILGPAYSGDFLKPFDSPHLIQKNFYKSDSAMLAYIGSIYTEIETKLFMYKTMEEKNGKKVNLKQLNVKGSDADILRYLGSLIPGPDQCLVLF